MKEEEWNTNAYIYRWGRIISSMLISVLISQFFTFFLNMWMDGESTNVDDNLLKIFGPVLTMLCNL